MEVTTIEQEEERPEPAAVTKSRPGKVGLTLSGGGYRATLFHLGVIRLLYEKRLLHHVTHVCSVSGGSILAAHLVLNWDRYTGDEASFDEASGELAAFTQTDLRGRVIRSWLFSWAALGLPRLLQRERWTRTKLLEGAYDELYRGATLRDLEGNCGPDTSPRPYLHILSSSMTTGHLVSFGQSEMRINEGRMPDRVPAGDLPVAFAVAASSAFPPLFAPVRVTHTTFGSDNPDVLPNPHALSDGGIFDNLGIRKLLWLNREQSINFDLFVVSDAQRSLAGEYQRDYNFIVDRASRSVDLLMDRVSWFENDSIQRLEEEAQSALLICRLKDRVGREISEAMNDKEQYKVQNIRTDLDAFTHDEINALVQHGIGVARSGLAKLGTEGRLPACLDVDQAPPTNDGCWHPIKMDPNKNFDLENSHRRKWGLFRFNDWASYGFWSLLLIYFVIIPVAILVHLSSRASLAEKRAVVAEVNADVVERTLTHTALKRLLIETLGDLAVADNADEEGFALEKWQRLSRQILGEPVLRPYFDADIRQIDDAIKTQSDKLLKRTTLELSRKLGQSILSEASDKFREYLKRLRSQVFQQAERAAADIESADALEEVTIPRKRFRKLYWGEMGIVEGLEVEKAMVRFREALDLWEIQGLKPKEELKAAKSQLIKAIDSELLAEIGPIASLCRGRRSAADEYRLAFGESHRQGQDKPRTPDV